MKVLTQLIVYVLTLLWFQSDSSLRVTEMQAPVRPVQASMLSGVTVVEVESKDHQELFDKRIMAGEGLFVEPVLDALKSWRFVGARNGLASRTSVTFVFRPASADRIKLTLRLNPGVETGGDRAAVPREIVDPGYPLMCLGDGTSILEVFVDAQGTVTTLNALAGPPAFYETARDAVKRWKFLPARISGVPVASRSYVVISFVRPTT